MLGCQGKGRVVGFRARVRVRIRAGVRGGDRVRVGVRLTPYP